MQNEAQQEDRRLVLSAAISYLQEKLQKACLDLREQIKESFRNDEIMLGELQLNYELPPLPDFKDPDGISLDDAVRLFKVTYNKLDSADADYLDKCQEMCIRMDKWIDWMEGYLKLVQKKYRGIEELLVDALIKRSERERDNPVRHRRYLEQIADILSVGFAKQIEEQEQHDFVLPCGGMDPDDAEELCALVAERMSKHGYGTQAALISEEPDPQQEEYEEE